MVMNDEIGCTTTNCFIRRLEAQRVTDQSRVTHRMFCAYDSAPARFNEEAIA